MNLSQKPVYIRTGPWWQVITSEQLKLNYKYIIIASFVETPFKTNNIKGQTLIQAFRRQKSKHKSALNAEITWTFEKSLIYPLSKAFER